MRINIKKLTLTKVFELSQFIKEKCKGMLTLEDTAQELVKILCNSLVTDSGQSAIVLNRFFKSCSYSDLPDDIKGYIKQKEGRNEISPEDKYLTLLGTWGDLEEWKQRDKSKNYKAFSLNDKEVLYKFPMLSAVFSQIGFKTPTEMEADKSIIVDKQDIDYGVFYVEYSQDSKFIPKQSEFVEPFGVVSTFGFGGNYANSNLYAVIVFCREHIGKNIVKLFLSLNPTIKLLTLRHEMTGRIFNTDEVRGSDRSKSSETGAGMEVCSPDQGIEYVIKCQETVAIADEVKKTNEALMEVANELKEKNRELIKEITARKRSDERAKALAHILEESLNEIYIFDAKTLRFLLVNKGARRNLGYSTEELNNFTPLDLVPDFTVQSYEKLIEPLRTGEKRKIQFTTVQKRKDSSLYNVEVHIQLSIFQSIPAFVAFIRDITEHLQMEEALLQSEKLKAMGVMTSGISHEFNNVLAIIKGFALLLKQKFGDQKEAKDKINVILKSVTDGIEIVGRMQEFTRDEVNRAAFKPIDVRELVEEVVEFSMPRWKTISEASGITYYIDKKGLQKVPNVLGNKTELREVVLNVMNNSLDAMPGGGHLSFRTWANDENIFLNISDTGRGMSEDIRKNIFDPFLTTKMPEGTGLGMSVSYGIIKRHKGKIYVKSEVGRGTTITIRLPITKDTNCIDKKFERMHELDVTRLKILVVDDEKAVCAFLNEYLSQEGQNVQCVSSGKEAIKRLKNETFDLVLCDLVMPEVGGREVIKMLNTLDKRPRVGLITGWSEKIENFHKGDMKVDFIIKKPFDFSELSKQINSAFGDLKRKHKQ